MSCIQGLQFVSMNSLQTPPTLPIRTVAFAAGMSVAALERLLHSGQVRIARFGKFDLDAAQAKAWLGPLANSTILKL